MNNSYRMNLDKFIKKHGPIVDLCDIGNAAYAHLSEVAANMRVDGQLVDNRLLGMSIKTEFTACDYIGASLATREHIMFGKGHPDSTSYSGKIWIRLEKEAATTNRSCLFGGTPLYIGTGGYSTWEGPWQGFGLSLQKLEQGVPWNLRRPLAAYAFEFQFYVSDFPELDQFALMQKLSDKTMPKSWSFFHQEEDLERRDNDYIDFLEGYKRKAHD